MFAFGSQSAGDRVARPTPTRAAVVNGVLVGGADQPLAVPVRFAFDAGLVDAQQPGVGAARTERANIACAGPVTESAIAPLYAISDDDGGDRSCHAAPPSRRPVVVRVMLWGLSHSGVRVGRGASS